LITDNNEDFSDLMIKNIDYISDNGLSALVYKESNKGTIFPMFSNFGRGTAVILQKDNKSVLKSSSYNG